MPGEQQSLPTISTFTTDQLFGPHPHVTGEVATEQADLAKLARKGTRCPCCRQFVKVYRNPFRWSAAVVLMTLVRESRKARNPDGSFPYTHLPTFLQRLSLGPDQDKALAALRGGGGSVVSPLLDWHLIERQPGERGDGDWRTGWYRPTPFGEAFALGNTQIQKWVLVYNGHTLGHEGRLIGIREALTLRFDYDALLRG